MQPQSSSVQTRHISTSRYQLPEQLAASDPHLLDYLTRYAFQAETTTPVLANVSAPLVLDFSTGRWALDCARAHPQAKVHTVSMAQRMDKPVTNLHRWTGRFVCTPSATGIGTAQYPPQDQVRLVIEGQPDWRRRFDLIRIAGLGRVLPTMAWPGAITIALDYLKAGGWLEILDYGQPATEPVHALPTAIANLNDLEAAQYAQTQRIDLAALGQLEYWLHRWAEHNSYSQRVPIGIAGGRVGILLKTSYHARIARLRDTLLGATTHFGQSGLAALLDPTIVDGLNAFRTQQVFIPYYATIGRVATWPL